MYFLKDSKLDSNLTAIRASFESEVKKANKSLPFIHKLPEQGISEKDLMVKLKEYLSLEDVDKWKNGSGSSSCVYDGSEELTQLNANVYSLFAWTNGLFADVFPDVQKMESEVVRMVCNMFNGDEDSCGTVSLVLCFF